MKLVLRKGVWTLVVRPSNSWWILFLLCMDEIFHFVCMASYFTRPYLVCLNHLLKLQWLFLVLRLKFLLCTLIVHRFTNLSRPCTGLSQKPRLWALLFRVWMCIMPRPLIRMGCLDLAFSFRKALDVTSPRPENLFVSLTVKIFRS